MGTRNIQLDAQQFLLDCSTVTKAYLVHRTGPILYKFRRAAYLCVINNIINCVFNKALYLSFELYLLHRFVHVCVCFEWTEKHWHMKGLTSDDKFRNDNLDVPSGNRTHDLWKSSPVHADFY